jgi:PadR family transcriptional regulator PadR
MTAMFYATRTRAAVSDTTSSKVDSDLLRGAGPTVVLLLLSRREMYGYELAQGIAQESNGVLSLGHSTLYPLLYNLESKGLITSNERTADSGRVRRYYRLTAAGQRALRAQRAQWQALTEAMLKLGVVSPA